jgi:DNA-binding transcriptional LysR family regulator
MPQPRHSPLKHYLPQIMVELRQQAPLATVHTVSPFAEKLEEGLDTGAVDLAIGYFSDIKNGGGVPAALGSERRLCMYRSKRQSVPKEGRADCIGFLQRTACGRAYLRT